MITWERLRIELREFGMRLEPRFPAGEELFALALAGEDAVEVAAMDTEFLRRDGSARETDVTAGRLMWGNGHGVRWSAIRSRRFGGACDAVADDLREPELGFDHRSLVAVELQELVISVGLMGEDGDRSAIPEEDLEVMW